jgi:hypothetical protein
MALSVNSGTEKVEGRRRRGRRSPSAILKPFFAGRLRLPVLADAVREIQQLRCELIKVFLPS